MSLAEYHRGYRERLGRLLLNPFDINAFMEWLRWTALNPGPSVTWGGK
jgi:hypothetical protein